MPVPTKKQRVTLKNRRPLNTRSPKKPNSEEEEVSFFDREKLLHQSSLVGGVAFMILAITMFLAFVSYFFTGNTDHDLVQHQFVDEVVNGNKMASNTLGLFGAYISHWFIFKWFGVAAFGWLPVMFLGGYRMTFKEDIIEINLNRYTIGTIFYVFFTSLFLGYFVVNFAINGGSICGGIGFAVNQFVYDRLMGWGGIFLLLLLLFIWVVFFHGVTEIDDVVLKYFKSRVSVEEKINKIKQKSAVTVVEEDEEDEDELDEVYEEETIQKPEIEVIEPVSKELNSLPKEPFKGDVAFTVEKTEEKEDEILPFEIDETPPSFLLEDDDDVNEQLLKDFGLYDPRLDLSDYKFPPLELLSNHVSTNKANEEELAYELELNKNKIVETMRNFSIGIASIKATVGPTVTLYEIIPEAGVRISKIKNLEDDIALSLAALGIRIIAPMPGKGTIGIEVPNKNREMVSTRSVVSSEKFQKTNYELPIILGKTISNEIFMTDLAKMPHLLMAGATGQGKSVGLNVILASLLYKKHPSEIKFVLVDPKKVELTLFNKIERHFLAMLPNAEEAIITDTKKVIYTLNSLCIEMDNRYDLLKDASVRNLREYNTKFIKRRLNPEKGHRYLPYIVLVIDELADLMMTAGKEVEQPIARLAQLARAIGIHLIVATQRPSVNVITGLIKANFPARLSFKVTAKVDSRTILDTGGAEQLVGNGDMLLSMGSTTVRLQCPFVDTPEVEEICEFIGNQRGYSSAYLLPEFHGDEDNEVLDFNPKELDSLFDDAARLIVASQQGSASLIQRKMKLGYNRAGRIIDQLESAGIVGSFEGSKAREVLVKTMENLEEILRNLRH